VKGLYFAHFMPDPAQPNRINVRSGVVKELVGADRFLLEFHGSNYNFSNVFNAEQLEKFAFFNTQSECQEFIKELLQRPAASETPDVLPLPSATP
jgi:hypothetical protein